MAVLPGQPLFKSEVSVARHPLRTHTVDIETIGAGGGSIAAVDLGVLKVGPQSAGADPGPACYDRGGSEPTLTDALVVLGHLNPNALLEGAMPISQRQGAQGRGFARSAAARPHAGRGGVGHPHRARDQCDHGDAHDHHRTRLRSARIHAGRHSAAWARRSPAASSPSSASAASSSRATPARSAPSACWSPTCIRPAVSPASPVSMRRTPAELEKIFAEMEEAGLADLMQEKFARERLTHAAQRRHALSRAVLRSQRAGCGTTDRRPTSPALSKRFHEAHRRRYGHMAESEAIEIVNFQVTAVGQIPKPQFSEREIPDGAPPAGTARDAHGLFQSGRGEPRFRCSVARRSRPAPSIDGPAVIEEKTSTTVLYPGQRAAIDGYLNIEITSDR